MVTYRHGAWHSPAHQRTKSQLHSPVGKQQPLLPGSLHKPLEQAHPPGGRHWPLTRKPVQDSRPDSPTRGQTPEAREQPYSTLRNWVCKLRSEPTRGPAGHWTLGNKREMHCLDTEGIPYWRKLLQNFHIHKNTNGNLDKMWWQRNMFQRKEKERHPKWQLMAWRQAIYPRKELRVMDAQSRKVQEVYTRVRKYQEQPKRWKIQQLNWKYTRKTQQQNKWGRWTGK